MIFFQSIDEQWFLRMLNKEFSAGELAKFQTREAFQRVQGIFEHLDRFRELEAHRAELPGLAELLRGFVDEWIESGYDGDREEPSQRNLSSALRLYRTLVEFWRAHPPELLFFTTGRAIVKFPSAPGDGWPSYEAARLMLAFFDSDLHRAIAKCTICGLYFERRRIHAMYKSGARCEKHLRQTFVLNQRKDEHDKLLDLAAGGWKLWTPRTSKSRAVWIANRMNRAGKGGRQVTGKWVTLNREEIERRSNAK